MAFLCCFLPVQVLVVDLEWGLVVEYQVIDRSCCSCHPHQPLDRITSDLGRIRSSRQPAQRPWMRRARPSHVWFRVPRRRLGMKVDREVALLGYGKGMDRAFVVLSLAWARLAASGTAVTSAGRED